MRDPLRVAGFTLIELLVAIAVLAIFIVGILGLLDSSQRLAKTESALADTQENVRYAAYHLLRTARMAGGTAMPFAQVVGGADVWVAGRLLNDQTAFTDELGVARTSIAGSDVLTLRGFFESSPYFVDQFHQPSSDFDWSSHTVTIREDVGAAGAAGNQDVDVAANELAGRALVFMGRLRYAVAEVVGNTAPTGAAGARTFTITFQDPGALFAALNPNGVYSEPALPDFAVYRVGILDSYTYFVNPELQLVRIRAGGSGPEPVAINIGSLQVALGVDSDGDATVDTWYDEPTATDVTPAAGTNAPAPVALDITVLGRTAEPVMGWTEPVETFNVRDLPIGAVDRSAKWRRMQVTATLRDFVL